MTQKQQIQANNAELEKHKQDILSLPMADDVKNGKYVWKKSKREIDSVEVKGSYTESEANRSMLLSLGIALFDSNKKYIGKPNEEIFPGGATNVYILAPATDNNGHVIEGETVYHIVGYSMGNPNLPNVKKYNDFTINHAETFISYVVSDSETAYPDGGEKDGFWWERVKDVVLPEGVSKISFDSFTLSNDVILSKDLGSYYIPHSLKEKPKKAYIIAKKTFYQSDEDLAYFEWKDTTQKNYRFIIGELGYSEEYVRLISNGTGLSGKGYAMIDAEKLILYWIADNYQTLILRGGNTYTLITMA